MKETVFQLQANAFLRRQTEKVASIRNLTKQAESLGVLDWVIAVIEAQERNVIGPRMRGHEFQDREGGWTFRYLPSLLTVTQEVRDPERGLPDIDDFVKRAGEMIGTWLRGHDRRSTRLSTIVQLMISDLPPDAELTQRFLHLPPSLRAPAPAEWDSRIVGKINRSFGGTSELTNSVVELKRGNFTIARIEATEEQAGGVKQFEGIKLQTDLNTVAERLDERFDDKLVRGFFSASAEWQRSTIREVTDQVRGTKRT